MIIKIIILYFIQIRHTDDFPSTGIRLVITMQVICETAIWCLIKEIIHTVAMIYIGHSAV